MNGENVLVTGVAGFVGSHLAEILVTQNSQIRGIDNLSRGSLENIRSIRSYKNFSFSKGDILDKNFLQRAMRGIDLVFHEAALIDVNESIRLPHLYQENNVVGLENVLEAARVNDVKRLIFASSCAVYGDQSVMLIREDAPFNPLSPYAETKIKGENLCRKYREEYGLPCVVLRYFNIYGPGQKSGPYSGVITQFIEKVLRNESPIIYGDGNQTRNFIHVDDIVQANILASTIREADGETFNIGSAENIAINNLAKMILDIGGKTDLQVTHAPPRTGDIIHSQANIEKAQQILGFKPQHALKAGLTELYRLKHG